MQLREPFLIEEVVPDEQARLAKVVLWIYQKQQNFNREKQAVGLVAGTAKSRHKAKVNEKHGFSSNLWFVLAVEKRRGQKLSKTTKF